MNLRTIVVDDSIVFRKAVRDSLASIAGVEVIDIAKDGLSAVEKIKRHQPDLVTLDVEMPGLNGLEVLLKLREAGIHTNVIMISSLTERGATVTTRALENGAFDFVLKPNHNDSALNANELRVQLSQRIAVLQKHSSDDAKPVARTPRVAAAIPQTFRPKTANVRKPTERLEAIVLGISTGGPKALRNLIPALPGNMSIPLLIVQHMPPIFTRSMAEDLNRISNVNVVEAENQMSIQPGWVYIAPGGKQMRVAGQAANRHLEITDDAAVNNCRPSVDYLFESASRSYGPNLLAIVMTGMGNDGTDSSRTIARNGGSVWAQDEQSCTVFGMPRRVIEANLADEILSLDQIQTGIIRCGCQKSRLCYAGTSR